MPVEPGPSTSGSTGWLPLEHADNFGADLGGLPLVLVGPILRRVTSTSVSVFLVLSKPATLGLDVHDMDAEAGAGLSFRMTGITKTIKLGARVHVALVTATILAHDPSSPSNRPLSPGTLYCYDVSFTTDDGNTIYLSSGLYEITGISHGSPIEGLYVGQAIQNPLCYGGNRPSFMLPPSDLSGVRLLHGSCRKPHGDGKDGLAIVDQILADTWSDPSRRPQQLFLTGDQIYADDVADALLHLIRNVATQLFGWEEDLPVAEGRSLNPNQRGRIAEDVGFSWRNVPVGSGTPDPIAYHRNQLLKFQEFCAMYLLVWSPLLWQGGIPLPMDLTRLTATAVHTWLSEEAPKTVREIADSTWNENIANREKLRRFLVTLPLVRRALANIPTYMIFDDHEVTDDLFLNLHWTQGLAAQNNHLGRVILGNAFAAYAIFQGWGNDPEQYAYDVGNPSPNPPPGGRLLELFDRTGTPNTGNYGESTWDTVRLIVLPTLATGIQDLEYTSALTHTPDSIRWHYSWSDGGIPYEIYMLDCRTWRAFPGDGQGAQYEFCGLISKDGLQEMIPATVPDHVEVTIVVSPAPYLGSPIVELIQSKLPAFKLPEMGDALRQEKDAEAWALECNAFERLLAKLALRSYEATNGQPPPSHLPKVVVLSGDVHYGFTQRLQYWAVRPFEATATTTERTMVLAQLTSSSLKKL